MSKNVLQAWVMAHAQAGDAFLGRRNARSNMGNCGLQRVVVGQETPELSPREVGDEGVGTDRHRGHRFTGAVVVGEGGLRE